MEELQAANLAIRSDFRSFINTSSKRTSSGKRVGKSATALSNLKSAASLVAYTAQDSQLQELIQKYQIANPALRKKFYQTAKKILEERTPSVPLI